MTTLVEWLTAQLDEDECIAEAAHPGPWRWNYEDRDETPSWAQLSSGDETVIECEGQLVMRGTADAEHIALHDPAAVLADIVAAKRKLIGMHRRYADLAREDDLYADPCYPQVMGTCANCGPGDHWSVTEHAPPFPCQTLRITASAYRHRDGYRPEWAPT